MRRPARHRELLGFAAFAALAIAVYVTFVASHGLPLVPRYELHAEAQDAAQVSRGAEVTIAGTRVGQVTAVKAIPGTPPRARLDLAIETRYQPLPADSTFAIRLSGSLGRKVVAITPGRSSRSLPDGATLATARQRMPVVDTDQLLNAFDERSRAGSRLTLETYGLGFAGRGADVNATLELLPGVLTRLAPVAGNLAAPRTALARFIRASRKLAGELRPVAGDQASLFVGLERTFTALATVAPSIERAIAQSPPALAALDDGLRRTRPFLRETTALLRELRPGARALPATAPLLADALEAGGDNFPLVPALSARLDRGVGVLAHFSQLAPVRPGVQRLQATAAALAPPLAFLTPAETSCSYLSLLLRNAASLFKENHATGTTVRVSGVVVGVAPGSERGPSKTIFTGKTAKALGPVHSNPYPNTMAPGQPKECEAGNEPYITNRAVVGNVPGVQRAATEDVTLP